jgi:BirA family biotin operon repressor/biotin-[acetyl-CoA-carboxylase] ligase
MNGLNRKLVWLSSVDSTQEELLRLISSLQQVNIVVVADKQEKGRGRVGRAWVTSPFKSIAMSLAYDVLPQEPTLVTFAAGVACSEVLSTRFSINVGLKWPNDLYVENKKLGGILAEVKHILGHYYLLLGIGLNVNQNANDFPSWIQEDATSLKILTKHSVNRKALVKLLVPKIDQYINSLNKTSPYRILDKWKQYSCTLGQHIIAKLPDNTYIEGVALDLDTQGALLIRELNGRITRLQAGDITIRHQALP